MGSFLSAQFLVQLALASPNQLGFRIALGIFIIWACWRSPVWGLLGGLWQLNALIPYETWHWRMISASNPASLRCDACFWFLCSSSEGSALSKYLSQSILGHFAGQLRSFVESHCLAWHPLWGDLAMSLIMGSQPDESLKALYKNLGFLHVLVISGSQFSILANWLTLLLRSPLNLAYASTLLDWRQYRPLCLILDILLLLLLFIYLLACGATPPCQRAFLEQAHVLYKRWLGPADLKQNAKPLINPVFKVQALLFPTDCFGLSALLSWGAVYSLKLFAKSRSLIAQLKVSLSIQLLSLAVFSRLSIASLLLDFFLSPIWDLLLFVCLLGIFAPSLGLQSGMTQALDFFHALLWQIDLWQLQLFGSSALKFRDGLSVWGRLLAGLIFIFLFLSHLKAPRPLTR